MSDALEFGPYTIDREQRLLMKGDHIAPLAPKLFDLLLVLVESDGRVLEKKSLLDRLWPETFVEEGSLTRNISSLRKVLGESPNDQRYISTVARRGYRFVAPVHTRGKGRDTVPPLQGRSIAVKPLKNVSDDTSLDHFAEILTEALLSELSGIPRLKVVHGAPVEKNSNGTRVAETLDTTRADLVFEGSLMRVNHHVRVLLALADPHTRSHIWSRSYDREPGGLPALQEEAGCSLAAEVRAHLIPERPVPFRAGGPKPEAFDSYLRGRFYARRQNRDDNETAIRALERAVTIDPSFATAYAELAQAYTWKLFLFAPREREWEEKAFVAVEKALSLDPDLAVAYLARGRLLWTPANHFPHLRAVREYRRALALDSNLDEARNQLALVYCHIGFFDEALRESHESASTNPNNHLAIYRAAETLAFQGNYQEALTALRAIPQEVNPALIGYQTAWVLFNLGKSEEAAETIERLLKEYPHDDGALFVSMQAVLAASAGEEHTARSKIQTAVEEGRGYGHFHHAAYHIAVAYALMNDVEQAIYWLNAAAMDGFPCYPLFQSDRNLDTIRRSRRFLDYMEQLRLHWLEYKTVFKTQ